MGGRDKEEKGKVERVKEVERWLSYDTPFRVILDKSGSDVSWRGRE